jgi:hypothetical protein
MQETLIQQQRLGSSSGPLKYTNHPPQYYHGNSLHRRAIHRTHHHPRRLLLSLILLALIPHPPVQYWVVYLVTDRFHPLTDSILFLKRDSSKDFATKAPRSSRSAQGLQAHLTVVRMFGMVCMPDDSSAQPDPRQHA